MDQGEKRAMVFLEIGFLAIMGAAAWFDRIPEIPAVVFYGLLGLAAYRGGRAVSYNRIFKFIRDWIGIVEVRDSSGAGDSTEIGSGVSGFRRGIAELILCPVCSGTWIAAGLVFIYSISPEFGRVLVASLGAAGAAELFLWIGEFFEWRGREARESSGSYWIEKNRPTADRDRIRSATPVYSRNGNGKRERVN